MHWWACRGDFVERRLGEFGRNLLLVFKHLAAVVFIGVRSRVEQARVCLQLDALTTMSCDKQVQMMRPAWSGKYPNSNASCSRE